MPGLERWLGAACRRLDLAIAFHTPVGVKFGAYLFNSDLLNYPLFTSAIAETSTDGLALSIDALNDRYTLLGTPLARSPHVSLVASVAAEERLDANEYVERLRTGTLDRRTARPVSRATIDDLRESTVALTAACEQEALPPIKIARVGGQTYVADGKHRAAVHLFLGRRTIACQDVTPHLYDSWFRWIRRKTAERPAQYAKHLRFFEDADHALGLANPEPPR